MGPPLIGTRPRKTRRLSGVSSSLEEKFFINPERAQASTSFSTSWRAPPYPLLLFRGCQTPRQDAFASTSEYRSILKRSGAAPTRSRRRLLQQLKRTRRPDTTSPPRKHRSLLLPVESWAISSTGATVSTTAPDRRLPTCHLNPCLGPASFAACSGCSASRLLRGILTKRFCNNFV